MTYIFGVALLLSEVLVGILVLFIPVNNLTIHTPSNACLRLRLHFNTMTYFHFFLAPNFDSSLVSSYPRTHGTESNTPVDLWL